MMYFLPEEFGNDDCLVAEPPEKVTEMENRLEDLSNEDDTDSIYEEYFQYVMERNNIQHQHLKQVSFLNNLSSLLCLLINHALTFYFVFS